MEGDDFAYWSGRLSESLRLVLDASDDWNREVREVNARRALEEYDEAQREAAPSDAALVLEHDH